MSRRCELSGKGVMSGNNVSHAHNKTRRRFLPNLQVVSVISESLNKNYKMRLATSTIRTIEKCGGLDDYLLSAKEKNLTEDAVKIKKAIKKVKDLSVNS